MARHDTELREVRGQLLVWWRGIVTEVMGETTRIRCYQCATSQFTLMPHDLFEIHVGSSRPTQSESRINDRSAECPSVMGKLVEDFPRIVGKWPGIGGVEHRRRLAMRQLRAMGLTNHEE